MIAQALRQAEFSIDKISPSLINPSVKIDFSNESYQVKTATTPDELMQALSLRFEVFFREFSTDKKTFSLFPYDVDVHDFICDHLIVKEIKSQKVIACYRLRTSNLTNKFMDFYSEGEFEITSFVNNNENKIELGRACVHKEFRSGSVISLLWKGLLSYAKKADARYMFGCSSICREDFGNVTNILTYLEKKDLFIKDFDIGVQPKYRLWFELESVQDAGESRPMNSLMHMYLLAGARMGKALAYDAEMDCIDMFTLMDLRNLPQSFARRFA